jgi:hypothetical protein
MPITFLTNEDKAILDEQINSLTEEIALQEITGFAPSVKVETKAGSALYPIIKIEETQDGAGEASPTNIRAHRAVSAATVICESVNQLNVYALPTYNNYVINNGDGTLTVNDSGYGVTVPTRLKEIAPSLKAGKTYYLSVNTNAPKKFIYLMEAKTFWYFGTALVVTQEMLESRIVFYYNSTGGAATLSELMIVEGNEAPGEYIPYNGDSAEITLANPCYAGEIDGKKGICTYTRYAAVLSSATVRNVGVTPTSTSGRYAVTVYMDVPSAVQLTAECSHFTSGHFTWADGSALYQCQLFATKENEICFGWIDDRLKNASEAKNWLDAQVTAGTPVTITYQLATPIIEALVGDSVINAAEDVCTITSDVGKLAVVYTPMNVQVVFDNIKKRVEDIEGKFATIYDNGLKKLHLFGDVSTMTKENAVTLNYEYDGRIGMCTVKWQGSSSLEYPKKNYTIKFDNAFEASAGWGEQKKYCLKANWIDHSHMRNIISARLWGQMVRSRATQNTELSALPNGGAINGFPIQVFINDEYQGLYTFNIPKDGWMYGMGEGTQEALICADVYGAACYFKAQAAVDGTDFELEYATDEDNTAWVAQSLNELITACINCTGDTTTVESLTDMDSAIDHYCLVAFMQGTDNLGKNYLMAKKDNMKWTMSPYDMDCVYGNSLRGNSYDMATSRPTFATIASTHQLMGIIKTYKADALKARWNELRQTVLSEANFQNILWNFAAQIPANVYAYEAVVWPSVPGTTTNNAHQMIDFMRVRLPMLDAEINAL